MDGYFCHLIKIPTTTKLPQLSLPLTITWSLQLWSAVGHNIRVHCYAPGYAAYKSKQVCRSYGEKTEKINLTLMMPLIGENSNVIYLSNLKCTAVKVLIRTICFDHSLFPHWVSEVLHSIFALGDKNPDLNEKLLTSLQPFEP